MRDGQGALAVPSLFMCSPLAQKMKENRKAYETLAGRAVQLLATVANTIMKAGPDKRRGMEGNVAQLILCVLNVITPTHPSDHEEQHAQGDRGSD
jgi:hypothetical protein